MKIFWLTMMIVLISAAAGAAVFAAGAGLDDRIAGAEKLAAEGRYDDALESLRFGGADFTNDDRARIFAARGKIDRMAGNYKKAIEEYDTAVNLVPDDPCMRGERAILFESLGQPGAALADAELSIGGGCEAPKVLALRGRLYLGAGDYLNAVETLSEVLGDETERPRALSLIGTVFMLVGFPETALEYFKKAEPQLPDNPVLTVQMADCYSMLGRFDEALEYYKRAVALSPGDEIASNNYGYTLFMLGRADEALELFKKQTDIKPTPYSVCNTMEVYLYKDDREAAMAAGQWCLDTLQNDPETAGFERYYFGAALRAMRFMIQDRLALHPRTQLDLARRSEEKGEPAEALAAALVALMLEPADRDAMFEAGRLYSLLGETSKASSFLNLAIHSGDRRDANATAARELLFQQAFNFMDSTISTQKWF